MRTSSGHPLVVPGGPDKEIAGRVAAQVVALLPRRYRGVHRATGHPTGYAGPGTL